jgi:hypothetical protein
MKFLTIGFALLMSVSAFGNTKSANIVELKELNLHVFVSCSAPASNQKPRIYVTNVDGSPYENSRPEEFSFRLDSKKNKDSKYSIVNGKYVWLKLNETENIKIGTLDKSIMEDFNAKDCTISNNYFPFEGKYVAQLDQKYKYLVNVEDIKNYCDANSKFLEMASVSGKKSIKAKYIVFDQNQEKIVVTGTMRQFSKEVCITGITVAKGIGEQIGAILFIPVAIIVALLGGYA